MIEARLARLVIEPEASLRDAMLAIDQGSYEIALVVDHRGRLLGTVSDGDVRRALLSGHALDDPVVPHVCKEPRTTTMAAGRAETLDVMKAHCVAQVPVVDDAGNLVGLHVMRELLGSVDRPNWAVIMAGGRGTRLAPLTDVIPKPMVRVAGRPILERLVLHLVGSGIHRIVISVNYLADVIERHFGSGEELGCRIDYLREDPTLPLGTGGSLSLLSDLGDLPEHPLLVMNGDLLTQFSVAELLEHHRSSGATATVGIRDHSYEVPYGVVQLDADGHVTGLTEKPLVTWAGNAGVYVLNPALVLRVPRTPFPLPDLLAGCLTRGDRVSAWYLDDEWHDLGQHADLRRATGQG